MRTLAELRHLGLLPVLGMTLIIIGLNAALQDNFFARTAVESNISSLTPMIFVSVAQAIIIINRELDLSVGAGVSLLNCMLASFMPDQFGGVAGQLLVVFLTALVLGGVNGVLVAVFGLPSLIATFGTSALWFGCALLLRPQPGGMIANSIGDFYYGDVLGLPAPLVLVLVGMALWVVVGHHRFGRWIVGIGSNPAAAFQAGIPVVAAKVGTYVFAWVFVFLSAFAISAQTLSGDARLAQSYAITSVAACVIGGISLTGGRGSPWGALLGAIALGLIGNVIYFAGVPSAWQTFVKGLIIVAALGLMVFEQQISIRRRAIAGT